MFKKNIKNQKGFTLIETIIVLTILALVLPAIFSIIIAITKQQGEIYKLVEIKQQGDYTLNFIKKIIKENADTIKIKKENDDGSFKWMPACGQNNQSYEFFETKDNGNDFRMYIKNNPDKYINFGLNLDSGLSYIGYTNTKDNKTNMRITKNNIYIPYFYINCFQKNDLSKPLIEVQFAITYKNKSGKKVNQNPLIYQTKIKLN